MLSLCSFFAVLVVPIYVDVVTVAIAALNQKIASTRSNTRSNSKQVQAFTVMQSPKLFWPSCRKDQNPAQPEQVEPLFCSHSVLSHNTRPRCLLLTVPCIQSLDATRADTPMASPRACSFPKFRFAVRLYLRRKKMALTSPPSCEGLSGTHG